MDSSFDPVTKDNVFNWSKLAKALSPIVVTLVGNDKLGSAAAP
jgi:hypothetical protein